MLNQTSLLACIVLVVILVTLIIFYSYKRIVNNEEEVARLTDRINAIENSQGKLGEFVHNNMLQMQMNQQMMGGHVAHSEAESESVNNHEIDDKKYAHHYEPSQHDYHDEGLVEVEEEEMEQSHQVLTLDDIIQHARETQDTPEEDDVYHVDESEKIENDDDNDDILEAEEYEPDDEDAIDDNTEETCNGEINIDDDQEDEENYGNDEEEHDEEEHNEEEHDGDDDENDEVDENDENDEEEKPPKIFTKSKRGRKTKKSIKKKQLKQTGPKGRVPSTAPREFEIGHRMRSDRDGQLYEVTESANGRIRWLVIKDEDDDADDED